MAAPTTTTPATPTTPGDADLAAVAGALAQPARTRMLLALGDGRALPAGVLASEAGVAASTASEHLSHLVDAGLITVWTQGRHRYYRLAGPHVGELIEALARVARPTAVRSLREGTRAHALRRGRTCYDHLAGRLGVVLFAGMLRAGHVTGGDGVHHLERDGADRLSSPGRDVDYRLTASGEDLLGRLGVPEPNRRRGRAVRYCVDWTEQRHHLAGDVGRLVAQRTLECGWVRRAPRGRAAWLTPEGRQALQELGLATAEEMDGLVR